VQIAKNINGLDIQNAEDVLGHVMDAGGSTLIDFGMGDSIMLLGTSVDQIHADPSKYFMVS